MNVTQIPPRRTGRPEDDEVVEQIVKAISSVRYGHVQIVIQDSPVIQIDKTRRSGRPSGPGTANGRAPWRLDSDSAEGGSTSSSRETS